LLLCAPAQAIAAETGTPPKSDVEEVRVTGQRTLQDFTEIDPDAEKLFNTAGTLGDPLTGVLTLPGVTTISDSAIRPAVRGSGPGDNTFLIDGIPVRYIFHRFGNSIFDDHLIHSFDFYPGAYGSAYSGAIGAVMDVTLRDPANKPFTTTANLSFLRAGVLVESGIGDDQAFYASYRESLIHLFYDEDKLKENGIDINSQPIADDYQAKYSWNISEGNSLSFVAAGASDTATATFNENSNEALKDPDFLGKADLTEKFDSGGFQFRSLDSTRASELYIALNHTKESSDFDYGTSQFERAATERTIFRTDYSAPVENHRILTGAIIEDAANTLDLDAKIRPCAFFVPECTTVNAERVSLSEEFDIQTRELYAEDHWDVTGSLALTYGAHYSVTDYIDESFLEPRLRIVYRTATDWELSAATGRYHQLPELLEIAPGVGNPDLKHSKSDHYVLGVARLYSGWSWKAEAYYKEMWDLALALSEDSDADFRRNYSNDATGEAYGVELFLNKDLTKNWYGWISLSLSETRRVDERTGMERDFDYSKPLIFNIVGNRESDNGQWLFGFKWSLQSGSLYTPIVDVKPNKENPDVMEPVYGELNSERMPTYQRLDLRLERKFDPLWGEWSWYVDLINTFNRENIEGYYYAPNEVHVEGSPPRGFGPNVPVVADKGLRFFPSIGAEFTF
jgi:hypothetical protein